jgi:hypothetical protein
VKVQPAKGSEVKRAARRFNHENWVSAIVADFFKGHLKKKFGEYKGSISDVFGPQPVCSSCFEDLADIKYLLEML